MLIHVGSGVLLRGQQRPHLKEQSPLSPNFAPGLN